MTIPPFLNTGDTVAIIAPSGSLENRDIDFAIKKIKSWGLKITFGRHLHSSFYNFSGNDNQRTEDLQEALDNKDIKAIFCARGGYGLIRIIDKINWESFIKSPKWIIGFSDVTVLHSFINNRLKIATLHSPMPINFEKLTDPVSIPSLKEIIFGFPVEYTFENQNSLFHEEFSGILIGGNLSLLYSLRGTPYDFDPDNKILFIEEIDEYYYHIDRMIQNLKLGNKFSGLKGIILGGFTDIKDNEIPFGFNVSEIVTNAIKTSRIPVINNFPAGHQTPNYPIKLGVKTTIKSDGKVSKLIQD